MRMTITAKHQTSIALAIALGAVLALTACGDRGTPAAPPRPVLVVHPSGAPEASALAFAGEVRAREESTLSFRVGGNLTRRFVDVGDAVRRGDLLAELDPGDLRL